MKMAKLVVKIALVLGAATCFLWFLNYSDDQNREYWKKTVVHGTVEVVRVTNVVIDITKTSGDDDVLLGALIGGGLAGTKGAVVGAVLGSESSRSEVISLHKVGACGFVFKTDAGEKISFRYVGDYESTLPCSLLRSGDRMQILRLERTGQYEMFYKFGETIPPTKYLFQGSVDFSSLKFLYWAA